MTAPYILVVMHTPLTLLTHAGHDDMFFITTGKAMSAGRWLGPFNQFTLMKGPGYPFFLASNDWLGTPISLSHALFHCLAVLLFAVFIRRFIRSDLLTAMLIALLIWLPVSFMMTRVIRDQIYPGQTLLVMGSFVAAVYLRQGTALCATVAGVSLGWLMLTREEGIWLVPGLAILVAGAGIHHLRGGSVRKLVNALLIVAIACLTVHVGFRSMNYRMYGDFIGVDVKEENFLKALRWLQSVRTREVKPFVSVTYETMAIIGEVSPSFRSLLPYFQNQGKAWAKPGCRYNTSACGEIGAGWFLWALRDAAAARGHYASPKAASAFFGKIAREVQDSCSRGALTCAPQLVAEMPPWTWSQLAKGLSSHVPEALELLSLKRPQGDMHPSTGSAARVTRVRAFLNFPRASASPSIGTVYEIHGWYEGGEKTRLSATLKESGTNTVKVAIEKLKPEKRRDGPWKVHQDFRIMASCRTSCSLVLKTAIGDSLEVALQSLRTPLRYRLNSGILQLEDISSPDDGWLNSPPADRIATEVRQLIAQNYKYLYYPLLALGVTAFLTVSVLAPKRALTNACYVLAMALWVSVISRVMLLVLVSSTSFPAINFLYLSPAYYLLVSACIASIATALQLAEGRRIERRI